MKTIMVIDGADNCAYDCFGIEDDFFALIFPAPGQDIEFMEDFDDRISDPATPDAQRSYAESQWPRVWATGLDRKTISGIDGILFFGLTGKKPFYPNKSDSDLDGKGRASRRNPAISPTSPAP